MANDPSLLFILSNKEVLYILVGFFLAHRHIQCEFSNLGQKESSDLRSDGATVGSFLL